MALTGAEMPIKSPTPQTVPVKPTVLTGPPALNVPYWEQVGDNWCWAASLQMLLAYHQQNVQQCDMANTLLQLAGIDCCAGANWPTPTPDCDQPCPIVDVVWLYGQYGLAGTQVGAFASLAVLEQEITAGRPVEVALKRDGKTGHAVVVRWAGLDAGEPSVLVNDPWHADNTSISYQAMVDAGAADSWIGIV